MDKSAFEITYKQLRDQIKDWWDTLSHDYRKRAEEVVDPQRASLREILAKRVEEELERQLAKIQARQQNHTR